MKDFISPVQIPCITADCHIQSKSSSEFSMVMRGREERLRGREMVLNVQRSPGLNSTNTSTSLEKAAPGKSSVRARSGCSPVPPASSPWEGNLGRQAGSKSEQLWPASQ